MREWIERVRLAWALLWSKDQPLVHFVRWEFDLADRETVGTAVAMARVMQLANFKKQGAIDFIEKVSRGLRWDPVTPLTGEDWEWVDVSEDHDRPLWQNVRCPRVFKEADGNCYDTQGRVFVEPGGACYVSAASKVLVAFPYVPKTTYLPAQFTRTMQ